MRIGAIRGHKNLLGQYTGARGSVIEDIANSEQAIGCYNELKKYVCKPFLEPNGLELNEEVKWVNSNNLDLAVAFHNNAGGGDGWEALISVTGSTSKLARNAEKKMLALGQNSRGIKQRANKSGTDWYGFLRMTNCPAIIFETAFVDNKKDVTFIDTKVENIAIGVAYAHAIAETYGLKRRNTVKVSTAIKSTLPSRKRYPYSLPTVFPLGTKYAPKHKDVRKIQGFLVWTGITRMTITGVFNRQTEYALKLFQEMNGLVPDGVWGRKTDAVARKYTR